jgi:hypothetical protein
MNQYVIILFSYVYKNLNQKKISSEKKIYNRAHLKKSGLQIP